MPRRFLPVLALALALALAAVVGGYYALEWFRHMRAERNILIHQAAVSRVINPDRARALPLLFIGDSIFAAYPLRALWPDDFILFNRGAPGETMAEIAARYKRLTGAEKRSDVVLNGGINDLWQAGRRGADEAATRRAVSEAVAEVCALARRRGARVVYVSALPLREPFLLPHSKRLERPGNDRSALNAAVRRLNQDIEALCAEAGCRFVDAHGSMSAADGRLRAAYASTDGLHLSVNGYVALTQALLPEVAGWARSAGFGGGRP